MSDHADNQSPTSPTRNPWFPRIPGITVDRIDIGAGLQELRACSWGDDPYTVMVIEHSLQLWARGEEETAQRKAIDTSFHGINLTSWTRVLAAARAAAETDHARQHNLTETTT